MSVTTRFAPSPTGMLHIGGARTALFNALYAKKHDGKFLLRIEDTDKARSTQEAVDAILQGLDWLGLTPDEAPVFQSQRAERHAEVAHALLESGGAFKCYATPEELSKLREDGEAARLRAKDEDLSDDEREAARAEADRLLAPYRSPWRDGQSGRGPFTVRLRAPDSGKLAIDDRVQGRVEIEAGEIDDLILLRADGTPTYMLAVVVDDHDMGVSHVIRGDDHLRNAFRQLPIIDAMGWDRPVYAHLPLIHGADGAKLSKRHGALSTLAYRDMGYLPESVCAYLLRLGWSHGDREIIGREEAEMLFGFDGINTAPARLDLDKLAFVNGHFIRKADPDRLLPMVLEVIEAEGPLPPLIKESVVAALPHLLERADTIPQLAEACRFITAPRPFDQTKKARKALRGDAADRLFILRGHIAEAAAGPWDAAHLQAAIERGCEAAGLAIGQMGPPLRAALTGGLPAPDLAPVMAWLGADETLSRIDETLAALSDAAAEQNG